MKKKLIRLTESDLHNIIRNSVNKIMNEALNDEPLDDIDGEEVEQEINPEDLDQETLKTGFGDSEFDDDYVDDSEIEQQLQRGIKRGFNKSTPSFTPEDPKIDEIYAMKKKVDAGESLSDEDKEKLMSYAQDIQTKRKYGDTLGHWSELAKAMANGTYEQIVANNKMNMYGPELDDAVTESIKRTLKNMKLI